MAEVQSNTHAVDVAALHQPADDLVTEVDETLEQEAGRAAAHDESLRSGPGRAQPPGASRPPPLPGRAPKGRVLKSEHARWWKALTEPQKRAWVAYRERGLGIAETEKRDLLRAALSLHPNRDVAAALIADLRKTSRAKGDVVEVEREDVPVQPTPAPADSPGVTAGVENAQDDRRGTAFRDATDRVARLARELHAAQQSHSASYKALGLPELPKDSPRRKLLARAVAPERAGVTSEARPAMLQVLDHRIRGMHKDIVNDPLWIAADYLDRTTSLEKIEDRVREDEGVKRAQKVYREAEDRVRQASQALDNHAPRSRWQRGVDALRGRGGSDEERLRDLHSNMKEASLALHHAKRELEGAEREARDVATELNAQALEIRAEARSRRDELERPLRDALVDRFIAERSIGHEPVPQHLRDALDHGSLTYVGERTIGGFEYHEFATYGGTSYLADATELRGVTDKLDLARGDRVLLRSDELGGRHLEIEARGDAWPRSRTIEGQVVEIDKADATIRGVKVRDFKSGQERWVLPRTGDDLSKDYSGPLLGRLQVHDAVRIAPNAFQITPGLVRDRQNAGHQLGR